jgi:signal transduction histidine kinase
MTTEPETTPVAPKTPRQTVGEAGLRKIVASIPDAVIVVSLQGHIRFANPAAEALFGRPLIDLMGLDMGFPAVTTNKTEMDVVRPGGKTVTAEVRFVEVEWNGEPARIVTLRDVTDRKRSEERARQLEHERQARAEAEAASRAKSEFLATMSHELRTPLNAIIGYSQLLDLGIGGPLTDPQRERVGRITNSGRHLLGLVNEILDLAKVEAGRLSVRAESGRIDEVVRAALSMVQGPADARGVRLLGCEGGTDILYDGDSDRVRQILVNLLNNAVKFTAPGGSVTVECASVARPEDSARIDGFGPWVRVRVTDTGIGIPSARLTSIFDPFVQVEGGHTRQTDGSGLGLTISRRLARLMGGDLTVVSEPEHGSTFTLWLPDGSGVQRENVHREIAESRGVAAQLEGLSEVATGILRELPTLCEAFVDRLRAEAIIPNTESLRASQLADHIVSYVADIASTLKAIEEAQGQPSRFVTDCVDIHEFIAEKHGAHRARMGCTPDIVRREWGIVREEVARIIRRSASSSPRGEVASALSVTERFLQQGEAASLRSLARAIDLGRDPAA